MRARIIKPGFFTNVQLADLGPMAMILFAGLWCLADREGRLEDRPRQIKAQILPYFECDADELLAKLADAGFVERYTVNGCHFLQIVKWASNQSPHPREQANIYPVPSMQSKVSMHANLDDHARIQDQDQDQEQNQDPNQNRTQTPAPATFEAFWVLYPRKENIEKARVAWKALSKDEQKITLNDVPARAKANWNGRRLDKIPFPTNYLEQKQWRDNLVDPAALNGTASRPSDRRMDVFKEWADEQRAGSKNPDASGSVLRDVEAGKRDA